MRIPIRTSKWALWASRISQLVLPVLIVAVFLHRARAIDTQTFLATAGAGVLLGLVALIVAIGAYIRIWNTGDRGWRPASIGFVTGVICLSPLVFAGLQAYRYPFVHDVSTDIATPPPVFGTVRYGARLGYDDPDLQAEIAAAFPNAAARVYPLDAAETFGLVQDLVADREWEALTAGTPPATGTINAVATTWLGFRDEVAIRVTALQAGARVDVRSVSYEGGHDLGANGQRIEAFLLDLDDAVTQRTLEPGALSGG